MEPSPGTENFAMVCCKLYLAAQSAFLAFLQICFALVASQSALEWRMKSVPDLDRSQGSLTGLKCLWRGSKGSVTVSVQVDIRPAE